MTQVAIKLSGMSCGHCSAYVEGFLSKLDGVQKVVVNLSEGSAIVDYDRSITSSSTLVQELKTTHYEVLAASEN